MCCTNTNSYTARNKNFKINVSDLLSIFNTKQRKKSLKFVTWISTTDHHTKFINQNMGKLHFQSFELYNIKHEWKHHTQDLPILLSINFNPNTFATSHYTNIVFSICSVLIALISKTILLYFMHTKQLQNR